MTAPKSDRARIYESWVSRLERISKEVRDAFFHQALCTAMRDEIQARHPTADATFLVSYSMVYIDAQAMVIRRLADPDDETHSLAALIRPILRNPHVPSRQRYLDTFEPAELDAGEAARTWTQQWASPDDAEILDPGPLRNDLDRLAEETNVVSGWATKVLAHLGPAKPTVVPKYGEIRSALDVVATGRQCFVRRSSRLDFRPSSGPIREALPDCGLRYRHRQRGPSTA
jgi:hypothetical protein